MSGRRRDGIARALARVATLRDLLGDLKAPAAVRQKALRLATDIEADLADAEAGSANRWKPGRSHGWRRSLDGSAPPVS